MTTVRLLPAAAAAAIALAFAAGPAAAKDKVTVTFIGPLSGGNAAIGLGGRNSADLAVKLRNADAKAKYSYEIIHLDDECKPNVAVQVATKVATDKAVIGGVTHYCSAAAMATIDVFHQFGLPVVVWGAVLPDITYANDFKEVNRVNGTMINQNETAAKFMLSKGYKKWAVLHDTTDYGKGHNQFFSKFIKENGGEIIATFGVTADQQDFTAELTQIKSLKPEVVYFGGLTPLGVRIRSQMDKLGMSGTQFQGTSGIISDAYIDGASAALAEGTMAFREGASVEKLPGGKVFLEKYKTGNYSEPPEAYGAFAFAGMELVLDTIEKVGPDRRKVRDALRNTAKVESIVGEVTFDDHGQNAVALITKYIVQDGKWVLWEDSEYASGKRQLKK
jgi:branched-chain amino acid transport system substrate-binding protein